VTAQLYHHHHHHHHHHHLLMPSSSFSNSAELLDRFPLNDNEDTRVENGISDFCFPNGLRLASQIQMPKFFCFVLTNGEVSSSSSSSRRRRRSKGTDGGKGWKEEEEDKGRWRE